VVRSPRRARFAGVDRTIPNRGCERFEDPKGFLSGQDSGSRVGWKHRNRPTQGLDLVGFVEIRVT
jgi:hypothetical protein